MIELEIPTPSWAELLLNPARYKVAKGGRSGGKSHFFAELAVERMVCDPNCAIVCIREIQKSLKFSAKRLIEQKISALKVDDLFDITLTEIRRKNGSGVCIFQGMQDHTADSVKSLESFDVAWVEEAQRLSRYSLDLLRPTIRKPGSELWFSFNPCWPDDPVDRFFNETRPTDAIIVTVNAPDNPFLSDVARQEMIEDQRHRPAEEYAHIWLGEHKSISKEQIFAGKCRIAEFIPAPDWDGPYYGADWGFGPDPTAAVLCWVHDGRLWVERESYEWGLELDQVADRWQRDLPGIEQHVVRCDCAQPQSISYVKRHGIPAAVGAAKWAGSVEDGIAFLRNYREIVIHPQCEWTIYESRRYRYKTNAAGDILPSIVDADNHLWDCLRYALEPLISNSAIKIEARSIGQPRIGHRLGNYSLDTPSRHPSKLPKRFR